MLYVESACEFILPQQQCTGKIFHMHQKINCNLYVLRHAIFYFCKALIKKMIKWQRKSNNDKRREKTKIRLLKNVDGNVFVSSIQIIACRFRRKRVRIKCDEKRATKPQ